VEIHFITIIRDYLVGKAISTKRISKPILYVAIITLLLAVASIILLTTLSVVPIVQSISIITLSITCPISLIFFFIAYRRGKTPPDIQTKIEFLRLQYKSFRLKDSSKTYVCMVCKRDLEINTDVQICPSCNAYYHEEHLFQWLQVNTTCPVCAFDYYKNAIKNRNKKK